MRTRLRRSWRTADVLFTFGFRAAPWWMIATLSLTLMGAITWFVLPLAFKMFTDGAVTQARARVWTAAVIVAALSTLRWASTALTGTIGGGLTERVNFYTTQRMGGLTTSVEGIEHFERPEYLQELDLLNNNRGLLASGPRQVLLVTQLVVQLVGVAGLLASISPILAFLPVLGLVPFFTEGRSVRIRQRMEEEMVEQRRLANRLFELTATAAPAKELRVYGLSDELRHRHAELADEVSRATAKAALKGTLLSFAGWTVFAAGMVGGITLVAFRAIDGHATPGQVLMAVALAQQIRFQLSQVADAIGQTLTMAKTAHRFLWLEDYAAAALRPRPADAIEPPAGLTSGIMLQGVSFTYPGTDAPVLQDVDLTLPAGSSIAVVGENGAGKTTLVKLLTRMYRPTTGTVTVDGTDLDQIDAEAWRGRVAATFQDFVRYELMAGGTIGVGDVPRYDDVDAIAVALDRAAATEVVTTLPDGLDTKLGRSFKGGQELSGGQWQKLALGRGMMRDTPLLVVLDEPTASLDAMTEHALFERYADAARRLGSVTGAVTILVSHRFSTVRMADMIVVVDGGRIVESGTHAELIDAAGLYAELFNLRPAPTDDSLAPSCGSLKLAPPTGQAGSAPLTANVIRLVCRPSMAGGYGGSLGAVPGLIDRLLDAADDPAPQIRAVVTTLLIKALDDPAEGEMIKLMVSSDGAGAMLDPEAAAVARVELDHLLRDALNRRAVSSGESHLVRVLRDYLLERMDHWAERTVDDADNRRRAERLLVLADHPQLLAAAQRRGFMMGMSADDVRTLARDRVAAPVTPETVTGLWAQLEHWRERTNTLLADGIVDANPKGGTTWKS